MNRPLLLAAVALPLAWLAGRTTRPPAPDPVAVAAPPPAVPADESWDRLNELAESSPVEWQARWVREALSMSWQARDDSWLLEQAIAVDPAGTWRRLRDEGGEGQADRFARLWCRIAPREAAPFLLDEWLAAPDEPGMRGLLLAQAPVDFSGLGRVDPERALELIAGLPEERRLPEFFRSLLVGVADGAPGRLFEVFEQIRQSPGFQESAEIEEDDLLPVLAGVDPARTVSWAEERFGTLGVPILDKLIEGCAKSDVRRAMELYERLWESGGIRHQAARAVTGGLEAGDLDEGLAWIDKNAPASDRAGLKESLVSGWARRHPAAAVERYLSAPAKWPAIGHSPGLFVAAGKQRDLVASLDQLPAEAAGKLRETLVRHGLLAASPGLPDPVDLLRRDPAGARAGWQALSAAEKEEFAERIPPHGQDPLLVLEFLADTKGGIDRPAGHGALVRLALLDAEAASWIAAALKGSQGRARAIGNVHRNRALDDLAAADAWRDRMTGGR
jgi:hypothetical protein